MRCSLTTTRSQHRYLAASSAAHHNRVLEVRTRDLNRDGELSGTMANLHWIRRWPIAWHLHDVQELLGLADVSTTMVYTHVLERGPGRGSESVGEDHG